MGTKGKRRLGILAGVLVLLYLVLWKVILPAGLERAIPLVEQTAGGYINGQLQMETMEVSPDLTFTARNLRLEDEQGNLVAQVPALSLQVDPLKFLTGSGAVGTVTRITLDGGEDMDVESMGGDVGTTITVKDLFYNVPARRKFLRTVNTEGRYISDIPSKIALSRPAVHLVLTRDD